jgi:hypothetical protein
LAARAWRSREREQRERSDARDARIMGAMAWVFLEIVVALAIAVAIVWWTHARRTEARRRSGTLSRAQCRMRGTLSVKLGNARLEARASSATSW